MSEVGSICGQSCSGGTGGAGSTGGAPSTGGAAATGGSASTGGSSGLGVNGGVVQNLYFAVVGDTRPATINDTAGYPSSIINTIYGDIAALNPMPPFALSTGDYIFSDSNGTESTKQYSLYMSARKTYPGLWWPCMGNHECTGYTASNCGSGNADGTPLNYQNFLTQLLGPAIGQSQPTLPYYVININATDGSWTSKFIYTAANAWTSAQLPKKPCQLMS